MPDEIEQRPEGKLIRRAMQRTGRASIRKTAREVSLSEARLRQIISGYQWVQQGVKAPVRARTLTLARIAYVLDIAPEELEEAERPDAAEALRDLLTGESRGGRSSGDPASSAETRQLLSTLLDEITHLRSELRAREKEDRRRHQELLQAIEHSRG